MASVATLPAGITEAGSLQTNDITLTPGEEAEEVDETTDESTSIGPDSSTVMMLHCLFAMVFAAATLGLLNCLGFVVRSGTCCPASAGYSMCEIWQDTRSMMSFVLGALLCCILTRDNKAAEGSGKVQLYTCLL